MKNLKLGVQLNISFALVLFVPMIVATVFSIVYYSNKIEKEAINSISSDLKIADMIYRNAENDLNNLAASYSQKKEITVLLGLNLGEKIGIELNKSAGLDGLDMITVVDTQYNVLVRSHSPSKINEPYPHKPYISKAFSGKSLSGTEVLSIEELEYEGFKIDSRLFSQNMFAFTLTGISPVYDRQRENIVGAIIVRRILNNKPELIRDIARHLSIRAALFEHTRLIQLSETSKLSGDASAFIPPSPEIFAKVLEENLSPYATDMRKGGSISKYMPIKDFNGSPVGILMVQTDTDSYLETRNTAIITLLTIFFVGFILAISVKTIIERKIVIPVKRLKEGTDKIGGGEYGCSLKVLSGDEIGELTQAFNKMSGELQQYDRQLREHNLFLEDRVQERTAELQMANDELIETNAVLEETLERLNPGMSKLIGNNKQQLGLVYATELVADVCNYTKLNMILGETLMGEFMKKFFRESHKLLAQYRGMFDKTVGDQIVAIFGTPKDYSDASPVHPFDAIACALRLVKAAEALNTEMQIAVQDNYTAISIRHSCLSGEDRKSIKIEDLKFQCRIGINTSNPTSDREIDRMRMVMMGAETYVDYTAQGGAVIYAFRLEGSGVPGHIHIGENTKRLVSHVYHLDELPQITLKGLGVQSGYRVIGYQSLFESIYPKTKFYRKYRNNSPELLYQLIAKIKIGKIRIREVRKINEYLDVDIPYSEHLAGVYNLCAARALLAYCLGELLGIELGKLDAIIFASLWHNALSLNPEPESFEPADFRSQIPDNIDANLVEDILTHIHQPGSEHIEASVIVLCNYFDKKIFDRTYMQCRSHEILSAKEAMSLIKHDEKFDIRLLDELGSLTVVEDYEQTSDAFVIPDFIVLSKDTNRLVKAISDTFSEEQRRELVSKLSSL